MTGADPLLNPATASRGLIQVADTAVNRQGRRDSDPIEMGDGRTTVPRMANPTNLKVLTAILNKYRLVFIARQADPAADDKVPRCD